MCPHAIIYVSSYQCVLILLYVFSLLLLYVFSYYYLCPHAIVYTSEQRGDVDPERPDADATSV